MLWKKTELGMRIGNIRVQMLKSGLRPSLRVALEQRSKGSGGVSHPSIQGKKVSDRGKCEGLLSERVLGICIGEC